MRWREFIPPPLLLATSVGSIALIGLIGSEIPVPADLERQELLISPERREERSSLPVINVTVEVEDMTARPLFSPTRQPVHYEIEPPSEPEISYSDPPEESLPAEEIILPAPNLILQGIAVFDDIPRALVVGPSEGEERWLSEGDSIEGWELTRIADGSIRFEQGKNEFFLNLYGQSMRSE